MRGNRLGPGNPINSPILAYAKIDFVAVIQQLKQGLQLVVPVGPPARYVEKKIEFCRRGQAQAGRTRLLRRQRHLFAPINPDRQPIPQLVRALRILSLRRGHCALSFALGQELSCHVRTAIRADNSGCSKLSRDGR